MNILYINNYFCIDKEYILEDVGNNLGNLLFFFGTVDLLKNNNVYFNDFNINPDIIIISTANCISNITININYVGYLYNKIKNYNCKKYILSIGAQNNNLDLFTLNNLAKENINSLFNQCEIIYLRGEYTKKLLLYNNIKYNYIVNGCPSICQIKNLSIKENIKLNNNSKILFNLPREKQCNISFMKNIINYKIDYFTQDNCGFNTSYKKISYNKWKEKILNYDFIIGTRIHGSIMALIMNKPTLLIVIDSRTYELAVKLKIPYYNNIDNHLKFNDYNNFINFINKNYKFNLNIFNQNLEEIMNNYMLIFK